jgi:lipopolysaccharide biosynthesis glycosyltransferase
MDNKKELAIVLGATGNMTFALASVLFGIKKHINSIKYDVFVYYKDISDKEKQILNSIIPVNLIEYNFPLIEISKHSENRYSLLAYSRYECFDYLDEYKKVLWLDIDVLIQKDLDRFINSDNTKMALWQSPARTDFNFTKPVEGFDMEVKYYNTGVILFSDKLPDYKIMKDWCYKKTEELGQTLVCAEQGIINLLIQAFKIDVNNLEEIYNCHPEKQFVNDAVIIHPYAEEKFWNYYYNFEEWNNNYKTWLKLGGTSYKGKKANILDKALIRFKKKYMPEATDFKRHTGKFIKYVYSYNFKRVK